MSTTAHAATSGAGLFPGRWWRPAGDGKRIVCDLCPRECKLADGARGFCFVRQNIGGQMMLTTYGRSTGFCIDPIEKKPLNHFHPGTSVLSFGTAGCNLGCRFCQNWDISKSREVERLSERASPEDIARAAQEAGCRSVAFTYNDPVIWAEYAMDCAKACHDLGIKTVAVTAGYIGPEARKDFYAHMDAANVDLKAFSEQFYHRLCFGEMGAVLDTLRWLKQETNVWFEITTLLIPEENDSPDENARMCDWLANNVGPDVPLHFTAFHPDYKLLHRPPTPPETLTRARDIALRAGLRHVYVGNVHDAAGQSTYCPKCRRLLIERDWYALGAYHMNGNRCGHCGEIIAGHFDAKPGDWGAKRMPIKIQNRPPAATPGTPQDAQRAITAVHRETLQRATYRLLEAATRNQTVELTDDEKRLIPDAPLFGVFVSLKRDGKLRACMGATGGKLTLWPALCQAVQRAATSDPRFPPVSPDELPSLNIEAWLLHSPQPVQARGEARVSAITVGKHGLIIGRGQQRGLLLPGVATEAGWDARAFLNGVCRKARLPEDAWLAEDTTLMTFQGVAVPVPVPRRARPPARGPQLEPVRQNAAALLRGVHLMLQAIRRGATAGFPLPEGVDCEIFGVVLLAERGGEILGRWFRLSLEGKLRLSQALADVAKSSAEALVGGEPGEPSMLSMVSLRLLVLHQLVARGSGDTAWVTMLDPKTQGVLAVGGPRSGIALPPVDDPVLLLQQACNSAQITDFLSATCYSFNVLELDNRTAPAKPQPSTLNAQPSSTKARPPARAGQWYPADPRQLAQVVESCIAFPRAQENWPAVMVPHAGLRFSGRLAGETFCRVRLPRNLIVFGPNHTGQGQPWAVMPDDAWLIPGASVASSTELATALTRAVPGLELDGLAHEKEHSIEIQLPLICALSPQSAVVGITVKGSTSYDDCRRFARGMAAMIRGLAEKPLLVISTDLHHFATEQENRRLDQMALDAVQSLDPRRLYETCRQNRISMCGLLPAVIVMETLKELGQLHRADLVGYCNSASSTGDTSRVVGYGGMLLG